MKYAYRILLLFLICSCGDQQSPQKTETTETLTTEADETQYQGSTFLKILGTIQDAGSPHISCTKDCCKDLFDHPDKNRQVVALGLVDNDHGKKYLFEATPDITRQMKALVKDDILNKNEMVDGIFLTHAHIGHYAGLMYLGKEATNAKNIPVFAMPRMKKYLETNGPWSQLVLNNNIKLTPIENEESISLSQNLTVTPFVVPHRDEYSETVGYKIQGPNKTALFIPDIDKWNKWDKSIVAEIKKVDYAFLDATFYSGKEIDNRDISQIPHPFIIESLERFKALDTLERNKVIFIHFNHTNPAINLDSNEAKDILDQGFNIARINDVYGL
ncbi:MBL fold metallo-hydrolase [Cellulophaga baltica]|uniref:MBL fold metallo-hydrolase n=1 Tax=Cellulophaga baltica TaxID=76594 RepID=UPI0003FC6C3C|nr:MBL fold metallo-hydrolase [Cellulophaga baltica]